MRLRHEARSAKVVLLWLAGTSATSDDFACGSLIVHWVRSQSRRKI